MTQQMPNNSLNDFPIMFHAESLWKPPYPKPTQQQPLKYSSMLTTHIKKQMDIQTIGPYWSNSAQNGI